MNRHRVVLLGIVFYAWLGSALAQMPAQSGWVVALEDEASQAWVLRRSYDSPGAVREMHFRVDAGLRIAPHVRGTQRAEFVLTPEESRALALARLTIFSKTSTVEMRRGLTPARAAEVGHWIAEVRSLGVQDRYIADAMATGCYYSAQKENCDRFLRALLGDWGLNAWQRIVVAGLAAQVNGLLSKLEERGPFARHAMEEAAETTGDASTSRAFLGSLRAAVQNTAQWSWIAWGDGEEGWPREYARQRVQLLQFQGMLQRISRFLGRLDAMRSPNLLQHYQPIESNERQVLVGWSSTSSFYNMMRGWGGPAPTLRDLGWHPQIDFAETGFGAAIVEQVSLQTVALQYGYFLVAGRVARGWSAASAATRASQGIGSRVLGHPAVRRMAEEIRNVPNAVRMMAVFVGGELADGHALIIGRAIWNPFWSTVSRARSWILADQAYLPVVFLMNELNPSGDFR